MHFHHPEEQIQRFRRRLEVAGVFVLVCFLVLFARFFWLQVVQHGYYQTRAEENRIALLPVVPNRGLIVDRNGQVLANNYSAYTLEITPSKTGNLEATIEELSKVVAIEAKDRKRFKRLMEETKDFNSLPIRNRLSDEEVARFVAQRYRFPGVEIKARLFRNYPRATLASHLLGYIGRITDRDQEKIEDDNVEDNYQGTEYFGKSGLEQKYEYALHGETGFDQVEVDAGGRAVRSLSRRPPVPGANLHLTLDLKLQEVVEQAFGDNRGALVAIEPASGAILALVSMPGFDPNLFVDGIDSQSWAELNESPDRPMINRAIAGAYPPGSTFKPYMALAALELGKRTPGQTISDPGFFDFGGHKFRDDKPGGHGTVDMMKSIVVSCDTYYYRLANDLGIEAISDFMAPFGFGSPTGVDIEGETKGILPSPQWKMKRYKQKWYPGETVSIGIGQGYNAYTPIQLAQAVATLANNGVMFRPHIVNFIEDSKTGARTYVEPKPMRTLPLKPENIEFIKQAMAGVNQEGGGGTGAQAFKGAEYTSAGKTGTAQVVGIKANEKYSAARVAKEHRDHGLFIAFAPVDKPKIALAVLVENGGFGAQSAAPIARKAMDYYLLGKLPGPAPTLPRPAPPPPPPRPPPPLRQTPIKMKATDMTVVLRRLWMRFTLGLDRPLLAIVALLMACGLAAVFSASSDHFYAQIVNLAVAFTIMWLMAQVPPHKLQNFALPAWLLGVALLLAVALFGDVSKGARRWLHIGPTRIQPSEMMKIAMPLMLAWYFQQRETAVRYYHFLVAAVALLLPVALIAKQPDLGTAILVMAAGFYVIFFAGLPWKVMAVLAAGAAAAAPLAWTFMRDYQKRRILTLLDPSSDPLGAGYHIIQSTIAVGSGGFLGKGWLSGTQTHLEFIPERHTDFIFAVFSEEFGLIGNLILLLLYGALIARGLMIASQAATFFGRLLAGAITLIFFTYAFVNMGMVTGILPVVGVPLPFISYGGTALVTLFLGLGILMSIHRNRMLVQK